MTILSNAGRQHEGHTHYIEIEISDDDGGTDFKLRDIQDWTVALLRGWQPNRNAAFISHAQPAEGYGDNIVEFAIHDHGMQPDGRIVSNYSSMVSITITLSSDLGEIKHVHASGIEDAYADDDEE